MSGSSRGLNGRVARVACATPHAVLARVLPAAAHAQSSDREAVLSSKRPLLGSRPLPSVDATDAEVLSALNTGGALLVPDLIRRGGAYVLPPNAGTVAPARVTLNDNVSFCSNMRSLQAQARMLSEQLARLILDCGPADAELDALRAQSDARDLEAATYSNYLSYRQGARSRPADEGMRSLEGHGLTPPDNCTNCQSEQGCRP